MTDRIAWLTQDLADLPGSLTWLGPNERARLDQLRVAKRRSDFLLGRWTAKRAIDGVLGALAPPVAAIEVRAASDGAPEAFVDGAALAMVVSISHSAGRGLAALRSGGGSLGADLEHVEPRSLLLVEDFFTAREVARVVACDAAQRDRLITLIWSAKESALKALRRGLREDPRHVDIVVGEPGAADDPAAWHPLQVTVAGERAPLAGWWRADGAFIITCVGAPPVALPVPAGHVAGALIT
jgi:4'-phosphopantetheinyl transferase